LLNAAKSRAELGLIGKIISMSVGGTVGSMIGGPIGGAIGTAIGTGIGTGVAGTGARSLLEAGLTGASRFPIGPAIKGTAAGAAQMSR